MGGMPVYDTVSGVAVNEFLMSTTGDTAWDTETASSCASIIAADASGNVFLNKGTLMARITTAGSEQNKVGPFDLHATDGRQTLTNLVGYLDTFCNFKKGTKRIDCAAGVVYKGTVDKAKVIVYDNGVGTQGAPSTDIQTACRTASLDILHR